MHISKLLLICLFIYACGESQIDKNYLGRAYILPKGEYTIYNYGSRHIVRCVRNDGKYYYLNDNDFRSNGIKGYDAHQYRIPTKIIIK